MLEFIWNSIHFTTNSFMAECLKIVDHCRWTWQIDRFHVIVSENSSVIVKCLAEVPAAGGVITF